MIKYKILTCILILTHLNKKKSKSCYLKKKKNRVSKLKLPSITVGEGQHILLVQIHQCNNSLADVVHANRKAKKFRLCPNMSVETDPLINMLSVECRNWLQSFNLCIFLMLFFFCTKHQNDLRKTFYKYWIRNLHTQYIYMKQ